nr:hypothetical protein [uncultured archaeon]
MELAGVPAGQNIISEADKRSVITNTLHIPREVADFAHNLSDKYAIWIADSARKLHLKNAESWISGESDENGKKAFEELKKVWSFKSLSDAKDQFDVALVKKINGFLQTITGDYTHILDWLKGRTTLAPENDQINFKTLTFDEAKKRSDEWHKKLGDIRGGKIEDEEGEVIMTFPDGFYWLNLGKDYCEKESKAMGHCGRASGAVLYSLRKEQYPYVTAAVKGDGTITQMKGRANTKPKSDFHKYIIPFILGNNPDIQNFQSTYQSNTDFNINDLTDVELKQVVDKKPSLLLYNGAIALKRLSEEKIQSLLVSQPLIFRGWDEIVVLSDILRNDNMIDWAIVNAPELFHKYKFGTLKFNKEQLYKALSIDSISANLKLDEMGLDDTAVNWIVYNKPQMFEESVVTITKLSDEQKDYLVKNHPMAFMSFISTSDSGSGHQKQIITVIGIGRLQLLFVSNPILFSKGHIPRILFVGFLLPEMLEKYVKTHNKQNDPLDIFNNLKRLNDISDFMNVNTFYYFLKHYSELFWQTSMISSSNKEGGKIIGRYIVDHHFEWIEKFISESYNSKLKIQDWDLSPAQKQKIVNSDAEGKTTILVNYDENEIRKLNLSPKQVQQLLSSPEFSENLTLDLVKGFNLAPDREQTKTALLDVLKNSNNEDKEITIVNEMEEMFGEEYVHSLYNTNPNIFLALDFPVKYRDIERLKKYNNSGVSYEKEGIKIRFDDWSDDELVEMFKNDSFAKQIANFELDFNSYDYSFENIDNNFDDLDQMNIARVRFLIGKAFPAKFKTTIKTMKISELVSVLNDPDSISEDSVDFDDSIIDGIKDTFVRATEDAQRNADEDEYWKLYINPIKELFGEPKNVSIKKRVKGKEEIQTVEMLEFQVSYGAFEDYIKGATESGDYGDLIKTSDYVTSVVGIIKTALKERGEELEVNEPYNGVYGDIDKGDLNERFNDVLYEDTTISDLLNKTKIVVKKKKNETK